MGKKLAKRAAIGVAVGVALEHIAALITSIALHLGYYAPCLVSLPERVGGEINAVLWQMGLCALLGGVSGGLIANANQPAAVVSETDAPASDTPLVQTSPSAGGTTTSSDGAMSARDIYYDLACKQVVGIQTDITTTNIFGMTVSGSVSGSGFVISEDGYILTNYHVVEDAYTGGYEVKVMFYDGSTYTAEIKGFDRNNDIAVLKIDAAGLRPAAKLFRSRADRG